MKKKLLKLVSFVLTGAMCLGVLSGCGKEDTGKVSEKEKDTKTQVVETVEEEPKEMKEATIWLNAGSSKAFWEAKVQQFNEEKSAELGVTLTLDIQVDSAYNTAISVSMESGDLPDFFYYGSASYVHEKDCAVPLNDLPGMEDMIKQYANHTVAPTHKTPDGAVYALPLGSSIRGLIYNKDMFVAAGLVDEKGEAKPPKTLDEMREYAKILTDESKQQYGIIFPLAWGSWVISDVLDVAVPSEGSDRYDRVNGVYDYTVLQRVLEVIMGIKEDGSYYPGAESLDNDPARALFADGRIGMKFAYSFDVGVLTDQFPAECDWGVAPIPVADPNNCYMQTASYGSTVMVSKNGVENLGEEVCAEIIRYLYSDETRIELFEQGYSLLVDGSLADQAELADGVHEAWLEFAELAKISIVACSPIQSKVEGNGATAVIKEEIWTGNADIATALQDLTDRSNAGIKVYQEQNPDVDQSDRYDPDWNEKVSSRGSY